MVEHLDALLAAQVRKSVSLLGFPGCGIPWHVKFALRWCVPWGRLQATPENGRWRVEACRGVVDGIRTVLFGPLLYCDVLTYWPAL